MSPTTNLSINVTTLTQATRQTQGNHFAAWILNNHGEQQPASLSSDRRTTAKSCGKVSSAPRRFADPRAI